ncbi:heat shock protein HslJ [Tenacibaculum caenipelagi]|uniref:Heat shock protein HslJ n=2 Tax=Tenacibaculum caenipelagi TaxID=1325435 RepID=A0A4V3D3L1_9FLAO|nr:heat shock protein HslJ [Tenacibaculum caenipelagi]
MKKNVFLTLFVFTMLSFSCSSLKNMNSKKLYESKWELEYISGPRIAFQGLYPDKKPQITFNKDSQKVEGNNSCNGYSASYTLDGESISFGEPTPTTMMFCGQGEQVFLNTIKKVNKFSIDTEGKLNLMINDVSMMRFKKTE